MTQLENVKCLKAKIGYYDLLWKKEMMRLCDTTSYKV